MFLINIRISDILLNNLHHFFFHIWSKHWGKDHGPPFFLLPTDFIWLPTDLHTPNIYFCCIIFDACFTGGTSGNQLVVDPPSPWIQERTACSSLCFLTWLCCCSCSEFQYKLCSSRMALNSSLLLHVPHFSVPWVPGMSLRYNRVSSFTILCVVCYWSLAPVPSEM